MGIFKQGIIVRTVYLFCTLEFLRLLTSVFAADYLIPRLPRRRFALEDVIVLPINSERVPVSIICGNEEYNLSLTKDFRLTVPSQSLNISAAISQCEVVVLRTDREANVMLSIEEDLVPIHSTQSHGEHFIFINNRETPGGDSNQSFKLLVLATGNGTLVKICSFLEPITLPDDLGANFTLPSRVIPETINCNEVKIPHNKRLLLDNVSYARGIEIFSNSTIDVLAISLKNLSSKNETDKVGFFAQRRWLFPMEHWGNQYTILTEVIGHEVDLVLFCSEDTEVTVETESMCYTINITSRVPYNMPTSQWINSSFMSIRSPVRILIQCSSRHSTNDVCQNVINVSDLEPENGFCNYSYVADKIQYQWLSAVQRSILSVVCSCAMNVSVQMQSGDVMEQPLVNTIRHGNTTVLYLYTFDKLLPGVYRINVTSSINLCKYVLRKSRELITDDNGNDHTFRDKVTDSVIYKDIVLVDDNETMRSANGTVTGLQKYDVENISNFDTALGVNDSWQAGIELYDNRSATDVKFNKSESNLENNGTGIISTVKSVNITPTDKESTTKSQNRQHDNIPRKDIDLSSNDRFQMVADIVQTNAGDYVRIDENSGEARQAHVPTYIINVDNSSNNTLYSGKSLSAIVISLVAAVLAVVVFILMFVLSDFLSRRNQLRKTRIRPFVSYY